MARAAGHYLNSFEMQRGEEADNCGCGNGVLVDGIFRRSSKKVHDYFTNGEGAKILFRGTGPEKYYQN